MCYITKNDPVWKNIIAIYTMRKTEAQREQLGFPRSQVHEGAGERVQYGFRVRNNLANRPSVSEWIHKLWYILKMEHYSAIKRMNFDEQNNMV